MTKKTTTEAPPKCWVDQQETGSKKKLYGIWAKYNKDTKSKIEKECNSLKETKNKGAQKKSKGK